ncbi:MAG TPA: DUF5110 domain-containing protein [Candidatus Sulfotelmatobacter sp.]|nr:DUF5110 domain-containing protein [Candidatus Sulfotelmatobacter sp.]
MNLQIQQDCAKTSSEPHTKIVSVRVYPGANGSFTLFQDDGKSYDYEKSGGSLTKLTWDDAARQLRHESTPALSELNNAAVFVIGGR